jgi:hypothetical protein
MVEGVQLMFALYYFKFYTIFRLFNVDVLCSCPCTILYLCS